MMPADWEKQLRPFDAIFFGAVGDPRRMPDHVSLWGSLLQMRRTFDLYCNVRSSLPARQVRSVRLTANAAAEGHSPHPWRAVPAARPEQDRHGHRAREHGGRVH
jgi:hypothetical protein